MHKSEGTQNLVLAALFMALGVLLPLAFHAVGAGRLFLPMHLPVLLSGFLVGPTVGLLVGLSTPLLSSLLTGMPPLMPPIAPVMTLELATYGWLSGFLYRTWGGRVWPALVAAMTGGRIVYGLAAAYLLPLFGFTAVPFWAPLTVGLLDSWPGILLQLVFVPAVVRMATRHAPLPQSQRFRDSGGS